MVIVTIALHPLKLPRQIRREISDLFRSLNHEIAVKAHRAVQRAAISERVQRVRDMLKSELPGALAQDAFLEREITVHRVIARLIGRDRAPAAHAPMPARITRRLMRTVDTEASHEIAAKLGVSERVVSTVIYRAKQEGLDVPPSPYWSRQKR